MYHLNKNSYSLHKVVTFFFFFCRDELLRDRSSVPGLFISLEYCSSRIIIYPNTLHYPIDNYQIIKVLLILLSNGLVPDLDLIKTHWYFIIMHMEGWTVLLPWFWMLKRMEVESVLKEDFIQRRKRHSSGNTVWDVYTATYLSTVWGYSHSSYCVFWLMHLWSYPTFKQSPLRKLSSFIAVRNKRQCVQE